jgi:RNA polymerase sigma factor (TIGR02999 family)
MNDLTQILRAAESGKDGASEQLLNLVYGELRRLAAYKMAHDPAGQTLQPTALVHEAWLRLGGDQQPTWQNRTHFFSAASEAMRRILIERARRKAARRHGAGGEHVDIDDLEIALPIQNDERLLALDEALARLAAADPAKAELVKLRYFIGLTNLEAAQALGISEGTAKRWWVYAKAWLYSAMDRASSEDAAKTS